MCPIPCEKHHLATPFSKPERTDLVAFPLQSLTLLVKPASMACLPKEYSNSRFNRTSIAYKQANLSGYGLCKPCKSWQKNSCNHSSMTHRGGPNSHPSKLHTVTCTFCICMHSQWAIHIQDSNQPLKGKGMMVTMVSSLPFDHVAAH